MTRHESREQAFILLFETLFCPRPVEEIAAAAAEAREARVSAFALRLAAGTQAHTEEIDGKIVAYSRGWSKERISKVALSVMRLAVYEMLFDDDTPVSVAINEAVELAKRYGGDEDASFINGILGSISREQPSADPA